MVEVVKKGPWFCVQLAVRTEKTNLIYLFLYLKYLKTRASSKKAPWPLSGGPGGLFGGNPSDLSFLSVQLAVHKTTPPFDGLLTRCDYSLFFLSFLSFLLRPKAHLHGVWPHCGIRGLSSLGLFNASAVDKCR